MAYQAIVASAAALLTKPRFFYADGSFAEMCVWSVPRPVPPSQHGYKYSLAYVVMGKRVIGSDNERGKGDHRHYKGKEAPYSFHSIERLLADFVADVERERNGPHENEQEV